ncbi:hypothetical protein [Streptomyces sp. NPDC058953]|uniref:hypothetical protein n=1 Tax=unclassified Streptomyces TaxID=2593676 RepID=UPI0036C90404
MTTVDTPAPPRPGPPRRPRPRVRRDHPLRAELLRGVGPWAGAAVAIAVAAVLYEKADPGTDWQTYWSEGAVLLRVGSVHIGGAIAAAAGCWQGGRERRRNMLGLRASSARSPLRQALVAVAPVVLWPVAAQLTGLLAVILATAPYASAGGPYISVAVADTVAIGSLSVLGFVAGRLVGHRLAPPLVGIGTWILLTLPVYDVGARKSVASLLNPADQGPFGRLEPVWWYTPASVLWTGGLAAFTLLLYAARRRAFAIVPLAAAVCGAAVLADTGEGLWRPDPALTRLVCDDGTPRICVEARHAGLRPQIAAALGEAHDRLRGVPGAPVRWVDKPDTALAAGEAHLPDPVLQVFRGRLTDPEGYARWAVDSFLGHCDTRETDAPDADWRRSAEIDNAVGQWLAPYEQRWSWSVTPDARRHLARLEAMTPAESRGYLARRLAVDACATPGKVPAP